MNDDLIGPIHPHQEGRRGFDCPRKVQGPRGQGHPGWSTIKSSGGKMGWSDNVLSLGLQEEVGHPRRPSPH